MIFILFFLQTAFAADWSKVKCPEDKVLADEFLRMNLSGENLALKNNSCLQQKDYKYLQVYSETPEGDAGPAPKVVRLKNYEITSLETKAKEIFVNFKATTTKGETVQDVISFFRLDNSPSKKLLGCAMLGSHEITQLYLLDKCK
jgi:hypothetical protein